MFLPGAFLLLSSQTFVWKFCMKKKSKLFLKYLISGHQRSSKTEFIFNPFWLTKTFPDVLGTFVHLKINCAFIFFTFIWWEGVAVWWRRFIVIISCSCISCMVHENTGNLFVWQIPADLKEAPERWWTRFTQPPNESLAKIKNHS